MKDDMDIVEKTINDLTAFLPKDWPMPLGWNEFIAQQKANSLQAIIEHYTNESVRLSALCQKTRGKENDKYQILWNIAATYLHAARFERDVKAAI